MRNLPIKRQLMKSLQPQRRSWLLSRLNWLRWLLQLRRFSQRNQPTLQQLQADPKTATYGTGAPFFNHSNGSQQAAATTNNNISITGVNLSDPYATTTSVVNAIKFGNVVVPTAPTALALKKAVQLVRPL
jgi:hypothetical protein